MESSIFVQWTLRHFTLCNGQSLFEDVIKNNAKGFCVIAPTVIHRFYQILF